MLAIDRELMISSQALEAEKDQIDKLQQILDASLGEESSDIQGLNRALSQLKERLASTESLLARLGEFFSSFGFSVQKPIAALVVEAESIRKVAVELQAALGREKQAIATYAESTKRKEDLERQVAALRPRVNRLAEVHATLESLKNEHSLKSAMEFALQQNRTAVERIFSRIHSPSEFRGLGSDWTTLVRKDGSEASLKEISTGACSVCIIDLSRTERSTLPSTTSRSD